VDKPDILKTSSLSSGKLCQRVAKNAEIFVYKKVPTDYYLNYQGLWNFAVKTWNKIH
jgi:hypothetical protein